MKARVPLELRDALEPKAAQHRNALVVVVRHPSLDVHCAKAYSRELNGRSTSGGDGAVLRRVPTHPVPEDVAGWVDEVQVNATYQLPIEPNAEARVAVPWLPEVLHYPFKGGPSAT